MPSIMKLLVEEEKKLISFHVCEVMRIDRREKLFFASPS